MKETFKFAALIISIMLGAWGYIYLFEQQTPAEEQKKLWNTQYIIEGDTLQVKDYSEITGEYLMTNNKIYHHLVIENTDTVGHQIYKNSVNGDAIPEWYNKD